MKILAVRFQNLNSLKGKHEICFNEGPLAEAGLFAITGPTGAGKTTVLDAITVGLYGLVHRHESKPPVELLTRHTAEAFSEVEFEANGKKYRSKWSLRRSRGKVDGKLQQPAMELSDLESGKFIETKLSQVPKAVEQVCGLSYQQFLRSVMLSQGDFARFLKADKNERSGLLEKITDTGIYSDISRYAYRKAVLEAGKLEQLKNKLDNSQLLTEEELVAHKEGIAELQKQDQALQLETNTLQQQLVWLQRMQELQEKAQKQRVLLQEHQLTLHQLEPDFIKLHQHEKARHYAGELTEIRSANTKLVEVQNQLTILTQQLPILEADLELASRTVSETALKHQEQEQHLHQLEPLLVKVTKLDHELTTAREQFQRNRTAYEQFEKLLAQETAQLEKQQEELSKMTREATTLKDWLKENERSKDLRENLPELQQALRDLAGTELQISRCQKEQQELLEQLRQEQQQVQQLRKTQEVTHQQHEQLDQQKQQKLAQFKAVLASKTLEELEISAQTQPLMLTRYERLHDMALQYRATEQKLQTLEVQITQYHTEQKSLQALLHETQLKYQAAADHLESLQKLVQLQQRFQEFEQERLRLQPHQPCPLCGSEHHPLVEDNYSADLPEEERKRDKQQEQVNALQQEISRLQVNAQAMVQKQELALQSKNETKTDLTRLNTSYTQLADGISIPISAPDELVVTLASQKETLNQLQQTLAQARSCSREVEVLAQQAQQLRDQDTKTTSALNQLLQSERHLSAQLNKLALSLQDYQEQQQAHTEIAESFISSCGLKYTAENRQLLYQTLERQALTYQQKQLALDQMREKYVVLSTEVKHLQQAVADKQKEMATRQEALKTEHKHLTDLKNERNELFGEKNPVQERQSAHVKLRTLADQAEQARAALQHKKQELQNQRNKQQECQQSHQKNTSLLEELRVGLLEVLKHQGIATIEALTQMLLDRDEAERLANLKAREEKQLTLLQKGLDDLLQELKETESRNLTDQTPEFISLSLQDKKAQHHTLIADKAKLEQKLEQDAQQREKYKELTLQLQEQQHICNRWNQLSDLIGSAEGHKFSRFAQGLTLAKLVQLANKHLQKLNDRYRILKSEDDELELHIVDTYQADTVRPMNSLSGGESFLVSLALALGLSDLAGRKTQINSLFIDEGFGTLDAETLDAAISTLENLQESGKMIGIISHVEALKERINTQIKVIKQAGGTSKIEITTAGY